MMLMGEMLKDEEGAGSKVGRYDEVNEGEMK